MPSVTVYQKPTCTTCRKVHAALVASGIDFKMVNYYTEPLTRTAIKRLLAKLGMKPKQLLRTKEPVYRQLKLGEKEISETSLIELMVRHPDLIQRPIVEYKDRAIIARPPEKINEFLNANAKRD